MIKVKLFLIALLLILNCSLAYIAVPVVAEEADQLQLVAAQKEVVIGEEWTVTLMAQTATPIYGLESRLGFDATTLEVVVLNQGDFLSPHTESTFVLQDLIDDTAGTIQYAAMLKNPAPPAQGQGIALSITFRAKQTGTSRIWIEDGRFGTQTGEEVMPTLLNAEIEITASNHQIIAPTSLPQAVSTELPVKAPSRSDQSQNQPQVAPNVVPGNSADQGSGIGIWVAGLGLSMVVLVTILVGVGFVLGISLILFWLWTIGRRQDQVRRY